MRERFYEETGSLQLEQVGKGKEMQTVESQQLWDNIRDL